MKSWETILLILAAIIFVPQILVHAAALLVGVNSSVSSPVTTTTASPSPSLPPTGNASLFPTLYYPTGTIGYQYG